MGVENKSNSWLQFQTVEVGEPKDGLNLQVSFIRVLIIISQKDTILIRNGSGQVNLLTRLFQLDTGRHIIPKIDDLVMTWSLQLVMHTCCFAIDHTMHPEPTSPPLWLGRLALITNYDWAPHIQLLVLKIILNPKPFKCFMKCCRKSGTFSSFTICKISHLDKYIYPLTEN